jgi:cyclopropane-fatty-acyl-phospholipid synthase
MANSLRRRVLDHLRARLTPQPPPLRLAFWDGEQFDFADQPSVTVTLQSPDLIGHLMRGDFAKLADAYVKGDLAVDGAIEDVLHVGISLAERVGRITAINRLARLARMLPRRHTRRSDAADVSYHYDVSNDFYRLWLDDEMIYSCAYFRTGTEDIHTAQRQKLDHICRKLRLAPGERLLDIGCGWGGLLRFAAQNYGVQGVGVTLSKNQYAYAHERIAQDGLADRIDIRLQDYRDIDADRPFDKIVSVGMYEHVGEQNYPLYFGRVRDLLKPNGMLLNHGIVATDADGRAQGPPGGEFIDRYVFPGGSVPHLSRVVFEVARAGLELADVEDLRPHYAQTLLHWTRRLEAARDTAIRTAGIERYRIWRVYLPGMAYAFDKGWLSIAQVVAYKPAHDGMAVRPWTREHQYSATAAPTLAHRLDWTYADAS